MMKMGITSFLWEKNVHPVHMKLLSLPTLVPDFFFFSMVVAFLLLCFLCCHIPLAPGHSKIEREDQFQAGGKACGI
jgi:hypothetical protein